MALTYSTLGALGTQPPSFSLPGVDGKTWSLDHFKSSKALVIIFMCNHCPYVKAVQGRINDLAKEFMPKGVAVVGINSNDTVKYPDDNMEAMKKRAGEEKYVFPYLLDETQQVAKAYGAVCTPDFYVYQQDQKSGLILSYRGRLDDNWKEASQVLKRDLADALNLILVGEKPNPKQEPSMGCSIKWKS